MEAELETQKLLNDIEDMRVDEASSLLADQLRNEVLQQSQKSQKEPHVTGEQKESQITQPGVSTGTPTEAGGVVKPRITSNILVRTAPVQGKNIYIFFVAYVVV